MITVAILINGRPIMARSAVNKGRCADGGCRYELDDGSVLYHEPADGAIPLAVAMLKTIKATAEPINGGFK